MKIYFTRYCLSMAISIAMMCPVAKAQLSSCKAVVVMIL